MGDEIPNSTNPDDMPLALQVSQKGEGQGPEAFPSNGAVSSLLEQLQGASSELSRARAALEAALQERPAAAAAATPDNSMSTSKPWPREKHLTKC